jgi:hypothetical protein
MHSVVTPEGDHYVLPLTRTNSKTSLSFSVTPICINAQSSPLLHNVYTLTLIAANAFTAEETSSPSHVNLNASVAEPRHVNCPSSSSSCRAKHYLLKEPSMGLFQNLEEGECAFLDQKGVE